MATPKASDIIALYKGRAGLPGATFAEFAAALAALTPAATILVFKPADTDRDLDTDPTDDPDLFVPLTTGRWYLDMELLCHSLSASPGIAFRFAQNDSLVIDDFSFELKTATIDDFDVTESYEYQFDDVTGFFRTTIPEDATAWMSVKTIFNVTTGGTLALQWAQEFSNAVATTLEDNSFMRAVRLGAL